MIHTWVCLDGSVDAEGRLLDAGERGTARSIAIRLAFTIFPASCTLQSHLANRARSTRSCFTSVAANRSLALVGSEHNSTGPSAGSSGSLPCDPRTARAGVQSDHVHQVTQEIPDADHEQLIERVAAIDVANPDLS
jgi:hypothetical protein